MDHLNPKQNDLVNRIQLTKTFLKLWMVFALATMVLVYVHEDMYRVGEEFLRVFCPPVLFHYFLSRSNNPKWIPWPFYYASFHLFTNVFLRVDTFALDIFMVIPLILSGYIAMKRSHAIWYSCFSVAMALGSFAVMELYHKAPLAIEVEHQSKNVYLIMVTIILCTGLLNHFKTLYDENIKKLEESLKSVNAYNKDNQLLINLITHDINNHLNRLLMSVEFLESLHDNPKKYQKYHEQAVSGVMDIRDIISNFKMLRGDDEDDGEFAIKLKEVRVDSVLQKLELIFKESLSTKQLKFVKVIHEGVDTVAVEPISFSHHLMANIMGNAIKFSQDEGEVRVTVYAKEERVCIEVSNRAPKEHLSNLKMKGKAKVVSKPGTHNEEGQGIGMKLLNQVGQFSNVDWQLFWETSDDGETLCVTNRVTVLPKILSNKTAA